MYTICVLINLLLVEKMTEIFNELNRSKTANSHVVVFIFLFYFFEKNRASKRTLSLKNI